MSFQEQRSHLQPFGYSFDDQDHQADASAAFPDVTGPPLLDDSDSHLLNDFFSDPDSFDAGAAFVHSESQGKVGTPPNIDWTFAPPPSFHGASTALASEYLLPTDSSTHNATREPAFQQRLVDLPSEEVLGAASTLLGNFATIHPQLIPTEDSHPPDIRLSSLGGLPTQNYLSVRHSTNTGVVQSGSAYRQEPSLAGPPNLPLGLRAYHGSIDSHAAGVGLRLTRQRSETRRLYRFGSDGNFNVNGYVLSSQQETEDNAASRLMKDMSGMGKASRETTEPSSPHLNTSIAAETSAGERNRASVSFGETSEEEEGRQELSPRKRRKFRLTEVDDGTLTTGKVDRKSPSGRLKQAVKAGKARKSCRVESGTRKHQRAPRENLTEEQKRNNHILSEQKRRNLIRQGFEDLNFLVPELRSGSFSKSNVLVEAANFLEDLVSGNKALQARLDLLPIL